MRTLPQSAQRLALHTRDGDAAIGEIDIALDRLEEAYEARGFWMVWLKVQPELDSLRGAFRRCCARRTLTRLPGERERSALFTDLASGTRTLHRAPRRLVPPPKRGYRRRPGGVLSVASR